MRRNGVLGALIVGFLVVKVVGRHHPMRAGDMRHGRRGRRAGFDLRQGDPRREWIAEFHRSLHEADAEAFEAEVLGTAATA